jgi:hypothetical protein
VARVRTTKKLAQRIDLNYFKRPTPLKRVKFWLSIALPAFALLWIAWRGFSGDQRVYSSGRMSKAHAVLEKECAACHVQKAGQFSAEPADSACLACHDGPIHHAVSAVGENHPACAECHTEHKGRIDIAAASSQSCAECHADLAGEHGPSQYAAHIHNFKDGHPEFAALRKNGPNGGRVPNTVMVNHAIHMKPIRRGPNGPNVQLECGNCHHPFSADPDLTYSDPTYRAASVSYTFNDKVQPSPELRPPKPASGRELMAPVRFADACAGCHQLTFDKRFESGVPHDEPKVVRAFLLKKFQEYIAGHPAELRIASNSDRDLTGKSAAPAFRTLTPAQWVEERTSDAEELLWRKTCVQCHVLSIRLMDGEPAPRIVPWLRTPDDYRPVLRPLPDIAPVMTARRWMPHARFDHDAHRGFTCISCHEKALTSTEASDVLLPGIATCQKCHAPGPEHAESRCFECHTYHDWSKRKEIVPKFSLPALQTGGR